MNTKNRIIQKLLGAAKKHRVLTYPVLALVAIISAVSNLFSWSTGAGKRVVAVVMVMVMLVSQSCFLTSSATEAIDDEETALIQQELQQEVLNREIEAEVSDLQPSTETSTEVIADVDNSYNTDNSGDVIEEENISDGTVAEQTVEQDYAISSAEQINDENVSVDSANDDSVIEDEEIESKLDGEEEEQDTVKVNFNYQQPGGSAFVKMTDGVPDVYAVLSEPVDGNKTVTKFIDSEGSEIYISDIFTMLDDKDGKWTVEGCYDFYGTEADDNRWCRDDLCSIPVSDTIKINETATELNLYAQSKLIRVYMKINDSFSNGKSYKSTFNVGDYEYIRDEEDGSQRYYYRLDSTGKAVATISNAEVFGYELSDVLLGTSSANSTITHADDTTGGNFHRYFSADITLDNTSYENNVSLVWDPMSYKVVYSRLTVDDPNYTDGGTASTGVTRSYVFDGTANKFASCSSIITDLKTGYDLSGWMYIGNSQVYTENDSVNVLQDELFNYYYCNLSGISDDEPRVTYARMFPQYDYADVEMYVTVNDVETSLDEGKITYVYGMPGNEYKFMARYKYKDTTRKSDVGNFTYNATATGAADLNINVKDNNADVTSCSSVSTSGPKGVNDGDGSIPLSIKVTDTLSDGTTKIKTFGDYSISVRRKKIEIDFGGLTISQKRKEYNGNKELGTERTFPTQFNTISIEPGDTSTPEVAVVYDSAEFESADASNDVDIIIHNPSLSGTNPNCYDLTGIDVDEEGNETFTITGGVIKQRNVSVNTVYKGNDLLAGQDDPDQSAYTLELAEGEDFDGVDGIDDIDDALAGGHFGTITYSLKDRTEKNVPGKYDVYADFEQDGNFYVTVRNRGKVSVGQKSPEEDVNYKITGVTNGEREDDGVKWYYTGTNPKISPIISTDYNYNKIIVSEKVLSDSELSAATGEDSYTVTEADNGKDLYIWLKNSGNKAVTTSTKININYDATAPKYESYEVEELKSESHPQSYVSTEGSGLYFPNLGSVLDFGTYTNSTININVTYSDSSENTDAPSGMDNLYYRIYTSTSSTPNDNFDISKYTPTHFTSIGDNKWTATIPLLKDAAKRGSIDIIAYDKAGNDCGGTRLKPDGTTDDYEWVVEDKLTKPERPVVNYSNYSDNEVLYSRDSASGQYTKTGNEAKRSIYIVTNSNGKAEQDYYNHCQATVSVQDTMSGIKRVEWYDNDDEKPVQVDSETWSTDEDFSDVKHLNNKVNNSVKTLTYNITTQGKHRIYVKVIDNAGNEVTSDSVEFSTDDEDPFIELTNFDESSWTDSSVIEFVAYDKGDNPSGISTVKVINTNGDLSDCDELKKQSDGSFTGKFDISQIDYDKESGVCYYGLLAIDNAGNVYKTGGKFDKLSTTAPEHPTVTYSSSNSSNEDESESDSEKWYTSPTKITVSYPSDSDSGKPVIKPEGAPVKIIYRIYDDEVGEALYDADFDDSMSKDVTISKDGIFHVEAWAESASGIRCGKDDHVDSFDMLRIDKTKPVISNLLTEKDDTSLVVKYDVTDQTSGVNPESIALYYNDGEDKVTTADLKWDPIDNGYQVSFRITKTGKYTLKVADVAGNSAEESIIPMSMKVKAVTNITDTGATIGANVIKGSFDISSATVSYRKYTDEEYIEAETAANVDPDTGNVAVSTVLNELEPATPYIFKVTAVSAANEVLEYEGYFRTTSSDQSGIVVTGSVGYEDNSTGKITVGIYEGNVCLMAKEIVLEAKIGQDKIRGDFEFESVPDGNYNIIATDGNYSKTNRLMISDGMIQYPKEYIELLLSGKTTSVELETDDTPYITVDNMDSIFTTADNELVDSENGSVEYKLIAKRASAKDAEKSALVDYIDKNEAPIEYYDFVIKKIVYDSDGDKISDDKISNLPEEISITIPLGAYAGDPTLKIVRVHDNGNGKYSCRYLPDEDHVSSTYTISTNQFSIYALVHSVGSSTTEQATTGTASTEQSTNTYNVVSVGDSVTDPTTEHVAVPQWAYEEPEDDDDDDDDVKEIKDNPNKPKSSGSTSVGSLTSSGSAKTGDTAPIAVMFGFIILSVYGIVVLRKKAKNIE